MFCSWEPPDVPGRMSLLDLTSLGWCGIVPYMNITPDTVASEVFGEGPEPALNVRLADLPNGCYVAGLGPAPVVAGPFVSAEERVSYLRSTGLYSGETLFSVVGGELVAVEVVA